MTEKTELAELDDEFNRIGSTMHVSVYDALRKQILERQRARAPEAPKADRGPRRRVNLEKLVCVETLCDPDELRVIEGDATTTRANTHGYAVDPLGASWELPLPLCLDHDTRKRLGWVVRAQAEPTRITFTAWLSKRGFYEDADDSWPLITSGDLAGVSAGFSDIGDCRKNRVDVDAVYHRWTWTELTICARGANFDAKILVVKSIRYGKEILMRDVRPAPRVVRLYA
jgi:hypothetical protein